MNRKANLDPSSSSELFGGPSLAYGEAAAQSAGSKVVPFIAVENGIIQSSPLGDNQFFDGGILKNLIHSSESRLVHAPTIDTESEVAGAATVALDIAAIVANTNNGGRAITAAFFPFIIIQVSAPQLNALPAGVIRVNPVVPYELHGTVALGEMQIAQVNVTNRLNITIAPWVIVQGKPRPTLGCIRTGQTLSVTVSGLATGSQVSLIVPGTTHPSIADTLSRL